MNLIKEKFFKKNGFVEKFEKRGLRRNKFGGKFEKNQIWSKKAKSQDPKRSEKF
jgi:hypothetical protein